MKWKIKKHKDDSIEIIDSLGTVRASFKNTDMALAHLVLTLEENDNLTTQVNNLTNDLLLEIEASIRQGASHNKKDDTWDSCGISTYADQMRMLANYGRMTIVDEYGRRVIAKFKVKE